MEFSEQSHRLEGSRFIFLVVGILIGVLVLSTLMSGKDDSVEDVIAVGDSTVSLADSPPNEVGACRRDHFTWAENIGAKNFSCPSATVRKAQSLIPEHLAENATVYITVGSNDFKKSGSTIASVEKDIQALVDTVHSRSKRSSIIFVGYLFIPYEPTCMTESQLVKAQSVQSQHVLANEAMRTVAHNTDSQFIDVSELEYPICDREKTYVNMDSSPGRVKWHTSKIGHQAITDHIMGEQS